MHVSKERLPKDLSYPLKTSALASSLQRAGITLDCSLNYVRNSGVFAAHFWPLSPDVAYERLYLTVGAVASATVEREREHMKDRVLPAFVLWVQAIVALPIDSPIRREKQLFSALALP